jgi:hypothetical protein
MPNRRFAKSRQAIAMVGLHLLALAGLATVARADVTINAAVSGPQYGDGGTFTVTTTGTVTSAGDAIVAQTGNLITTLTVDGVADGAGYGVRNFSGSTISSVGVSGTIQGSWGLLNDGEISSLSNGGLINALGDWGLQGSAGSSFGTLTTTASGTIQGASYGIGVYGTSGTIANAGRIQGTGVFGVFLGGANVTQLSNSGTITGGQYGVWNRDSSTLTTFTNSGLVNGDTVWGFISSNGSTLGTLTNTSSGTIQAGDYGIGIYETSGTISNAGFVKGTSAVGLWTGGGANAITLLENTGTFTGGLRGVQLSNGTITTLNNSGLVNGDYDWGFFFEAGSLGTLTNSGTIQSAYHGIGAYGTSGTISNSGLVNAPAGFSLYAEGTVSEFSNTGTMTATEYGAYFKGSGLLASGSNGGLISGSQRAFQAENGTLGTLTNSGTMIGGDYGVLLYGASGTVQNLASGRIEGTAADGLYLSGSVALLSNSGTISGGNIAVQSYNVVESLTNSGRIEGYSWGIKSEDNSVARIGVLTNSGTIQGNIDGVYLSMTGTLSNLASGRIAATFNDALYINNSLTLLSNAGTISGDQFGVRARGNVTTFTNSGLIESDYSAVYFQGESVLGTLTNSGTIRAGSSGMQLLGQSGVVTNQASGLVETTSNVAAAVLIADEATLPGFVNEGRIIAARTGVATENFAVLPTLTNSGTISGQAAVGVFLATSGTMDTLSNSGLISGFTAGVRVENGRLEKLANTGTITFTGTGTGPAVRVGPSGILGLASGTGGPAIVSTGSGAQLAGTIVNRGTIYHGFTIENQDVTVSADGGLGTFTSGTLNVVNGDLTVTSGTTTLDASISVNGGTGTVFNDGTLRLLGIENVTGNYQQNAGGVTLMDLLGTSSGQYGRLYISGSASFAGSLALDTTGLAGGLADGQTFLLFGFASYTGGFGSLLVDGTALTDLGGGEWGYGANGKLTEQWTGTTMSLAVSYSGVPEIDPASLASVLSLVVGSLGLAERRLRRRSGRTG